MLLPFCVYVLLSRTDHLLYIGFSANLPRRLEEHNQGKCKSTAPRRPLELIFCEFYLFKRDALRRESYFKTNPGKRALRLMLRETLIGLGYEKVTAIMPVDSPEFE